MAEAKYSATLSFTITKPSGVQMHSGELKYDDMDYVDVVRMQQAVTNALLNLGIEDAKGNK